jgi:hypothetical protein
MNERAKGPHKQFKLKNTPERPTNNARSFPKEGRPDTAFGAVGLVEKSY